MVQYHRERNGLIPPIEGTYEITGMHYDVLFAICERHFNHMAYKYPERCKDDHNSIIGVSLEALTSDVVTEIPDIYLDDSNVLSSPCHCRFRSNGEYASILDLIEYVIRNYRDVEITYHSYMRHNHITTLESKDTLGTFISEINETFKDKRLQYFVNEGGFVERIVQNDVSVMELSATLKIIKDPTLSEMVEDAIFYYHHPHKRSRSTSLIKIWGAFERFKTLEEGNKSKSANKIVTMMSSDSSDFEDILNDEFKYLSDIGNNYIIRHTETDKIPLTCDEHHDYLFQRCASLLVLGLRMFYKER